MALLGPSLDGITIPALTKAIVVVLLGTVKDISPGREVHPPEADNSPNPATAGRRPVSPAKVMDAPLACGSPLYRGVDSRVRGNGVSD